MTEVDSLWLQAPFLALNLWQEDGQPRWRLNPAAINWSLDAKLTQADWQTSVERLLGMAAAMPEGLATVGAARLQYRAVALGEGCLLWLTPEGDARRHHDSGWRGSADKLELMQSFHRMAFFERDAKSSSGWWDKHMFRLLGIEPALTAPSFEQALTHVHPDDRERLAAHHHGALRQAGRHEIRYRLALPDGTRRDVHTLTEVRNGADGKPATLVGVLIDDTDSAERERAQEAVSAKLSEALELASISVWRIDLQRRRIHYNRLGYRLTGVAVAPDGLAWTRSVAWPTPTTWARWCGPTSRRSPRRGWSTSRPLPQRRRQLPPPADAPGRAARRRGRVVAVMGVSIDQTARSTSANARRPAPAHRDGGRSAPGSASGAIDVARRASSGTRRCSASTACRRPGRRPGEDWIGQLVHPPTGPRERPRRRGRAGAVAAAAPPRAPASTTELRIVRPDGGVRWMSARSDARGQRDGRESAATASSRRDRTARLRRRAAPHEERLALATQYRRHGRLGARPDGDRCATGTNRCTGCAASIRPTRGRSTS